MKKVKKTAISGVVVALSVVMLSLGSVIEALDMSLAAVAGILMLFVSFELEKPYPQLIFAATSVLAVLLLPNKFGALIYVLIYGYYPLIKLRLDSLNIPAVLRTALKALLVAVSMTLAELATVFVFGIETESLLGKGIFIAVLLLSELSFFLYDFLLRIVTARYFASWRKIIQKYLK